MILRQWNLLGIFIGAVYRGKVGGSGGQEAVLGAEKSRRGKVFRGWARLTVNCECFLVTLILDETSCLGTLFILLSEYFVVEVTLYWGLKCYLRLEILSEGNENI